MQHLPNVEQAVVDERKMTGYLLSSEHPFGRAKARFFRHFGFRLEAWEMLRAALLDHARFNAVTWHEVTPFGMKYVIDGPLSTPDGRSSAVRVVWFVDAGSEFPRFVTAYPLEGSQS